MWYLVSIFLSSIFYKIIDVTNKKVIILFPMFIFFFISAFQYDVGTDYNNYINIYYTGVDLGRFYNANELLFYYIFKVLRYYQLGPQSVFIISSLIMTACFLCICLKVKENKINLFLFFLFFMTATGIYQNQLNGLRNFVAIYFFIIFIIVRYDRKSFKSLLFFGIGIVSHSSMLITAPFYFSYSIYMKIKSINYILIFVVSLFVYIAVIPLFVKSVVITFFPQYIYHLSGDVYSIKELVPKLLLLPLYFLSLYRFSKHKKEKSFIGYMMFMFSITYWVITLPLFFGLMSRVTQYFSFFYIFPLYYLVNSYRGKIQYYILIFIIVTPFVAKVTYFAKNEYYYKNYIFNVNKYDRGLF